MLSSIVVHKQGDMQPGPGFFDLAKQLGHKNSDVIKLWIGEVKNVFRHWSGSEGRN